MWFLFQKHQDCAVFGFGLFCLKLTGTFEASQPLGNSVAPLWDTRSVTEGKQGGFYNVSSLLLPILSSKQMASRLLWFFRGGERLGGWYKELKRAEKHAQPLTPPYSQENMCLQHTHPSPTPFPLNLCQKEPLQGWGLEEAFKGGREGVSWLLFSVWGH